MASYNLNKKS